MWGMQSGKFTCVGLGTKRLAPFAHSVLVIALSQTGLATLVCRWGLLRVRSRVGISNLRPRCCAGSSSSLIWMLHASASWFEWCSRGRCASQRASSPFVRFKCSRPLVHLASRVGQFSKNNSIFSQDFWPIWDQFLIRNFRNSIRTPWVFDKEWPSSWSRADFGRVESGLSHWDKPRGQAQPVPVGQADYTACPSGTSCACPNWDWERSKETSPCPMRQVMYPRWRPFLVPGQAPYPRWSLSQFHLSQLVPQSGSTRPWNFWSTGQ